jgi:hypothetical protein
MGRDDPEAATDRSGASSHGKVRILHRQTGPGSIRQCPPEAEPVDERRVAERDDAREPGGGGGEHGHAERLPWK